MGCLQSHLEIEADGHYYRLKKIISTGGFSQIYQAEDLEHGHKVAVKKILCHSETEALRVRNEIAINRRFQSSKYIIPLLGVSEDEIKVGSDVSVKMFALIFPLRGLGTLQDELNKRKTIGQWYQQNNVLSLFIQICSALDFMHNSTPSVMHRDLKPANLLFVDESQIQLIDFGSAVECPLTIQTATDSRAMLDESAEVATMTYRAPELFTCEIGTIIDQSIDIWSLGCVLYALCYFCSPFDEVYENGDSVALAVQSARLKFNESAPYSKGLKLLIKNLIKPNPKERPDIKSVTDSANLLLNSDKNE